ncbi:MAG: glycosyltransferase family 2 protein [Candidatus Omnitrophica bacterium]|nr:glycosyltransferase family 2 protein [Candidatus Omnitrophota bacterium]
MKFPSISVGFAVYNEEETIKEVLEEAESILSGSGLEYEILICNDGSTDRSKHIIEDMARKFSGLRVINHPRNLGIRATFEDLYRKSRKDAVFLNAADKQWNTAILLDMLPLLKKADIVIASRRNKPYGIWRRVISWTFNFIPVLLFGVRTFDAGAVKLMRREIIERFQLVSKSPFSEAERLIRAARAGYRIVEYPVEVFARTSGRSHAIKLNVLLTALADLMRVWYVVYFGDKK